MDSDDEGEHKQGGPAHSAAAASASASAPQQDDSALFDEAKHSFRDDDDEDGDEEESLSDRYLAAAPVGSAAHPSLASLGGASGSVDAVQRSAQLVLLDVPRGLQLGLDYWSFRVGDQFRGMKLLPPGAHFLWFSSLLHTGDQAPRVGCFMHLRAGQVVVKRWDKLLECLVSLEDEDEEARYVAGARRFDFDAGQGTYPLNAATKWTRLSNHISADLVQRLEPVDGGLISSFAVRKYKPEDKMAGAHAEPEQDKRDARKEKTTVPDATAAAAAALQPASVQIEDASDMRDEATADPATAAAASSSSSSAESVASAAAAAAAALSKFTSKPSTSFYSRVPSIASFVEKAQCASAEQKASLLSALHLDSTPLLDALIESMSPASAAASSGTDAVASAALSSLLGEFQFSFVAFLVGQDLEGFEAWKALLIVLASSARAIEQRYAFYEAWVLVLLAQVSELPRDFFIDPLSGDNFLAPVLQRLFDTIEQSCVPTSLTYAARELATLVAKRFHADPRKGLPRFRREDENTRALKEQAQAQAQAAGPPAAGLSEEQQRKQLLARLQAEAEDDEFAPTIAED